ETLLDLEPFNRMWHLSENGESCGQFDVIIIARNGKCANRLLRMQLSSIWTLLAASEDPRLLGSAASFKAPLLKAVSWMADNPGKLFRSQSDVPHCWTFFSTAAYGKRKKVPQ
ncbi:hypothetical protein CISIN_1g0440141mg, partial [Citrus sinensis]